MDRKYDPDDLSKDHAYELATTNRRRSLLRALSEDGEQSLDELVGRVVDDVYGESEAEGDGISHESVRISLLHTDLPKLADHDVVAYDGDDVVAPGENIDDLDPLV